jgi:hypothetical protein
MIHKYGPRDFKDSDNNISNAIKMRAKLENREEN